MSKEYTLIGGNGTVVSPLEVTEDGDYVAGDSRAFNPVKVRTGGGGSSTLAGLTDVDISNPADGQVLVYDAASEKWVNGTPGGPLIVACELNPATGVVTAQETAANMLAAMPRGVLLQFSFDMDGSHITNYSSVLEGLCDVPDDETYDTAWGFYCLFNNTKIALTSTNASDYPAYHPEH